MSTDVEFRDGKAKADRKDKESAPVDLAAEAADGLDVFAQPAEGAQLPLVPACKVKFNGLQYDSMDELPELKTSLTFVIEGYVVGHGQHVKANGEIQETATVKVTKVRPA